MKKGKISSYVVKRMPRYYRFLGDMIEEGEIKISSGEIARRLKLTPSQVRQDFNCFGEFGMQGYGYNVIQLRQEIGEILGIKKMSRAVIVGAGNIGQAICDSISFEKRGCRLVGIYDNSPEIIGKIVGEHGEHQVKGMEALAELCQKEGGSHLPDLAVICVSKKSARSVCEQLIALGIKNFWNFTQFDINLHFDDVNAENVHLGDSLLTLVYNINRNNCEAK
ncbi:MAG: redox-sensing transcriptional repressor Rex [Oscillospiraceae bacterium]|nr:redox-sensing transcriptional repressor Rex [Oscillospiraceae bacterium]